MNRRWLIYLSAIFLLITQCWAFALTAKPETGLKANITDSVIIMTNTTDHAINLRHASIQFHYFGKVHKITNLKDVKQRINFTAAATHDGDKLYTAKIYGTKNVMLLPKQSIKLALDTDKKDSPHHVTVQLAPTPVNVTISTSNANWVQTIAICNTTGAPIPLKNIELDFNFSQTMPTNIWGSPWVGWKVASQVNGQVVLIGGTQYTPDLPSDPQCMRPLTVKFNNPPSNPQPTGPFVFKAESGTPIPTTGNLNVVLSASPAAGLANPVLTVTGQGVTRTQAVTWGTTWSVTGLTAGSYTVTGSTVSLNGVTYTVPPAAATVVGNTTTNVTMTYTGTVVPPTAVTVTLINAPTATVPVTLVGPSGTITQTVGNGTVLSLAAGSYNVSSSVAGYNATITPNPLVVPNNTTLSISYTAIPSGDAGSRTVVFVNQCNFPVWFGFISGATPGRNGDSCATDADCYPGSVCVDRGAAPKHCFWKNPVPADGNFQLAPNGGTNSVLIPYVQTPMNAVFSGAAAGRTNCTAAGCETSDCGAGTGGCPAGRGFMPPTTLAEFTFQTNAIDYYDVSAVDGMNIPVAMAANNAPYDPAKPYDCAAPGTNVSTPLMGACSWDFTPPLTEYRWVRAGGNACTSNANCAAGTVCGLSKNPGGAQKWLKTCGKQLGWLNANRICGEDQNYGAPFNCQQQLPPPNAGSTMINMLGCAPIPSCYQNGAGPECCGCANWDKLGVGVPPAPYTEQCKNTNTTWMSLVQPGLEWIKRACPSVYTYPFDDMSSTFTCRVDKPRNGVPTNSVGYTITFCPGGKNGGITP